MITNLVEGSIWIDANKRTIVVWRVHWQNTMNVASFELLLIPSMEVVKRPASVVEGLVKAGLIQYCRDLERKQ